MPEGGQPEKRRASRVQPYVAPCLLVAGSHRLDGFVTDLGARGGCVHCDEGDTRPGAEVVLEVRLGRRYLRSRLPAVVRWVRPAAQGGQDLGVAFKGLGPEERKALEDVLEKYRRWAAQIA